MTNIIVIPDADGGAHLSLDASHVQVLESLGDQVRELLLLGDANTTTRLFPTAYAENPELEDEYRQLVGGDLLEKRLADLDLLEASLETRHLTADELPQWMAAVNSIRLVLGTHLDVSEDMQRPGPSDPMLPVFAAYEFLGWLVEESVTALSRSGR